MNSGIYPNETGVEFVICAPPPASMTLLLFARAEDETPEREIECVRSGDCLHAFAAGTGPGTLYLYRNRAGQRLLDPYARAVHAPRAWGEQPDVFPKGMVADGAFDWSGDVRPGTPPARTVIYEAHLRGFTRGDGGGTFRGFQQKRPHLKELGITAVEFLPLFEFNELEFHLEGKTRKHLLNFWGYSTRAFFAPMSRYAASIEPGAAVSEFKALVKALHAAGIEVILDVVFK